ncbi:MAG: Lin0512 family protein [Chloroflexota bacterium]
MKDKNLKRFILEFGMGLDQHGQDVTNAACKAVKDAVARSCLSGIIEVVRLRDVNDMLVDIHVACPHPEKVDRNAVLAALPFGQKQLTVTGGGMVAHGLFQPELGDATDEAYIANAVVTVWVDVDAMLEVWRAERTSEIGR